MQENNKKLSMDMKQKYYDNMKNNKGYTKGVFDSTTKYKVLATREGSYYSPETCYFAFVGELPLGTHYVDCE